MVTQNWHDLGKNNQTSIHGAAVFSLLARRKSIKWAHSYVIMEFRQATVLEANQIGKANNHLRHPTTLSFSLSIALLAPKRYWWRGSADPGMNEDDPAQSDGVIKGGEHRSHIFNHVSFDNLTVGEPLAVYASTGASERFFSGLSLRQIMCLELLPRQTRLWLKMRRKIVH